MRVGEIVDSSTVQRRIDALDSAWAALVNATHAAPATVAEAHAWVSWRNALQASSGFSQWLTSSAALNELDAWAQRYDGARVAAGEPADAPRMVLPPAPDLLTGATKLAFGLAALVVGVMLFRGKS